jgi:hypothetical protein
LRRKSLLWRLYLKMLALSTLPPRLCAQTDAQSTTTAALDCANATRPETGRLQRARSAAWRKRYHEASGIRIPCAGSMPPSSNTIAAKSPACKTDDKQ